MFRLAVFFCVLILGMENGVLPGAAEIEYWKWIGVVLCLASALMSKGKGQQADPLSLLVLTGCALADLFLLFTRQWETGIAGFLSCPAVSELQPDFPGTNTPAVPDPRRLVLYRRAASETAGNDLSGDVLRNSNQL